MKLCTLNEIAHRGERDHDGEHDTGDEGALNGIQRVHLGPPLGRTWPYSCVLVRFGAGLAPFQRLRRIGETPTQFNECTAQRAA